MNDVARNFEPYGHHDEAHNASGSQEGSGERDAPSAASARPWNVAEPAAPAASAATVVALVRPGASAEPAVPQPLSADLAGQCVLPAGWHFKGILEAAGNVTLSGRFEGAVALSAPQSRLHVTEEGVMDGSTSGANVRVDGIYDGQIDASRGRVELGKTSRVKGKVSYRDIQVEGGRHHIEMVHAGD
ncbi:MAG TPA: polymer-forming cytoskeletal protein [Novosphingobium sp.]|nr:polymer-forming cytoskeletal protein [Novosphingobium sp.]